MNDHDLITTMRESFTEVRSVTPVELIVSRSRAIRARRPIPGVAAVAVVAAAAGIAVAFISSGPATPASLAARTTAYVVSHVARALEAMPGNTVMVIERTTVPASYRMERWADEKGQSRVEMFTLAGRPVSDSGVSFRSSATRTTWATVFVDYRNKTWWRAVTYLPTNFISGPPAVWTCGNVDRGDTIGNPRKMAAQLRTAQACGELKFVSAGRVDGVSAIRLSGDFPGNNAVTYWVNATTYLPFRFTFTLGSSRVFQENLRWLAPTAANLANVRVPIPAGFTRIAPEN